MGSSSQEGIIHKRLNGPPSEETIFAVAEISNVDPIEFEQRLHDVVDPDALDALTDWTDDAPVGISFTFQSYTVSIEGDELVVEDRSAIEERTSKDG